ncbi:hypothetical protein EV1_028070 [Malus domestica]
MIHGLCNKKLTGGYTGNVYHEFNDGIMPLFITSQRFNKKVVFVILEYHNWWVTKYVSIVDFRNLLDRAYWPRIRSLIQDEEREAPEKHSASLASESSFEPESEVQEDQFKKPKLVIISRNGSRAITNENFLVRMVEQIGFEVNVLRPDRTTELAKIYRALNASDVMIGVHGAAMTHFMFMRPGSVFIQVIPLGTGSVFMRPGSINI